jgi:hypothetical protein
MTRPPTLWRVVVREKGRRPYYFEPRRRANVNQPPLFETPTPYGLYARKEADAHSRRLRKWRLKVKVERHVEQLQQPNQLTGEAA